MTDEDLRVRQLAYRIWESEGRPTGQDQRHWDMALKIVNAERASGSDTPVEELPLEEALRDEDAPMDNRGASDYAPPDPPTSPAQAPVSPANSDAVAGAEAKARAGAGSSSRTPSRSASGSSPAKAATEKKPAKRKAGTGTGSRSKSATKTSTRKPKG